MKRVEGIVVAGKRGKLRRGWLQEVIGIIKGVETLMEIENGKTIGIIKGS